MSLNQVISNEVLDIRDGTHDSPKYKDSGYPLITSKNLKQGIIDFSDVNLISEEDYNAINKRSKVDKGDILYSMIGSIGNYAIVEDEPDYAIKNVALFKFIDDRLYNRYFLHLLSSFVIERQIDRAMKGGTQKFVSLKILRNLKIPLPPLDQQKQIASILDTADTYRQKTKALIKKYDALTQSLFLDMFGDPVTNPKKWDKVKLNYLCDFKKKSIKPENIVDGETYLGLECIEKVTGVILEKFIVQAGEIKSNKFWFNDEYILYGKLRPYLNKVASPNFEGVCSTDIIPIKPIKGKSAKEFIISLLRGSWFVAFADERSSGANLPRISPKEVEKYQAINPPLELQNQFGERVKAIEAQKALAQQELDKADQLFNSLLQKAFKGELV